MKDIQRAKHSKSSKNFKTSLEWMSQLCIQVRSIRRFEISPLIDEVNASFWRPQSYNAAKTSRRSYIEDLSKAIISKHHYNEVASKSTLEGWRCWLWRLNFRMEFRMHLRRQHLTFHMLPHTLRAHQKVNANCIRRCNHVKS